MALAHRGIAMSKHTPREWHVGGQQKCTIYDKFGQRIANSFEGVMATHRTDVECEANARLIAAAPELLENLIGCMEALASHVPDCVEVQCARAAIAKATGEA